MRGEILVNLSAIRRNAQAYRQRIGDVKLIGVVKADGYGHGAEKIAKSVGELDAFAVATTDEAIKLKTVIDKPVLLLGAVDDTDEAFETVRRRIETSVWNGEQIELLERVGDKTGICASAHIAVDTGMNRIGVKSAAEFNTINEKIRSSDSVRLTGVYSHFFDGDDEFAVISQLKKFSEITEKCPEYVCRHIAASSRALDEKRRFSAVRIGLGLYGYGEDFLIPSLSLRGKVVRVVKCKRGETVGYNGRYKLRKDEYIATVSLGYADGLSRRATGGDVLIGGKRRKIVGNVCMDYCFAVVDGYVRSGDDATFIGMDGCETITAEEIATREGTIVYEVLTRLKRLPRRYV